MSQVAENAIARMIREAYRQGGILSCRDLGLILLRQPSWISSTRKEYETQHGCTLPHTGALHDMGSSVSHKTTIIRKIILEKKDPADVARECNHTQAAVDRYLKDYHRIKTLQQSGHNLDFIHLATQIAKHVIIQYTNLINMEENRLDSPYGYNSGGERGNLGEAVVLGVSRLSHKCFLCKRNGTVAQSAHRRPAFTRPPWEVAGTTGTGTCGTASGRLPATSRLIEVQPRQWKPSFGTTSLCPTPI